MTEGLTRYSPSESHIPVQQVQLRDAGVHVDPPLQVGAVNHHVMYHPLMPRVQRTRNAVYVLEFAYVCVWPRAPRTHLL